MKIFIGWDQRDINAYLVAKHTLFEYASRPQELEVRPIKEFEMRQKKLYWRGYYVCDGMTGDYPNGQMIDRLDGKPFSTGFSFTRFLVPELCEFKDEWVLFMDADMMFRADVFELEQYFNDQQAIICVKHSYSPTDSIKMDGVVQQVYRRKNWSSFMLMNPSKCRALSSQLVNTARGSYLHGFLWTTDEMIGELPPEWNFLCGHHDPEQINPKLVHFTRGTPDMGWDHEPFATEWIRNYSEADPELILT
jgi:hypothetical protein